MTELTCAVVFSSDLALEDVASHLGRSVLAGCVFGGKHDSVYDELPAVYSLSTLIDHRWVLSGSPESSYTLELRAYHGLGSVYHIDLPTDAIDISKPVAAVLKSKGIAVLDP